MKRGEIGSIIRVLLAIAAAAATSPGWADTPARRSSDRADSPRDIDELEEVVVTGTHIRGAGPIGSRVIVIDNEAIKASGYARLQDYLETLPQNFTGSAGEDNSSDIGTRNRTRGQAIDLRGLGASSTLVLVNGHRQPHGGLEGSFVDISSIASSAVERVEILPDGASALYGSDAIGGVVNFVLRKDYDGFETGVRYGSQDGAADEITVSQLVGTHWDAGTGGSVLFGYQHMHRDAQMAADSFYGRLNQNFTSLGGTNRANPGGNPGTILTPTVTPAFAIPAGQNGTRLTNADLVPGTVNYSDFVTHTAVRPEQELQSAFLMASQRLGERFEIFAEGRYGERTMTSPSGGAFTTVVPVPLSNPFRANLNPFGGSGPLLVQYDFAQDLGQPVSRGETKTYVATVGAIAQLSPDWQLSMSATRGQEKNIWLWDIVNHLRLNALAADSNPATALNVFGDGSHTNPDTLRLLQMTQRSQGETRDDSITMIADGSLLELPMGTVRLALGADYRDQSLDTSAVFIEDATGTVTLAPRPVGDLDRNVSSAFGELSVPIIGAGAGSRPRMSLSLAGRYEDYSDFGSTFDPRAGLSIEPLEGLVFRGTWGTSFRAPRFNELSPGANPPSAGSITQVADPASPTGFSNILTVFGVSPDLSEETADVWSAGFDLKLAVLPGFSLSANYFDIDYADKIVTPGPQSTRAVLQFERQWADIITRSPTPEQIAAVCTRSDFRGVCPTAVAAIVDFRLRNIAALRVRGIDLDLNYQVDSSIGQLSFGVSGTHNLEYSRAVSDRAEGIDVVDTVGNPLRLRMRGKVGWALDAFRVDAFVNYLGAYKNVTNSRAVDSWTTVDASISYEFAGAGWLDGTTVQLAATNVLDQEPPFVATLNEGFDVFNAHDMGRWFGLNLTKRW